MGIKMKRSSVAGKVPVTTDLELGELGVNTRDGKLFLKKDVGGAESIVEVGPVVSVAGRAGAVTLAKADVGLGNVDNTSDANKPVSSATQTALDGKAAAVHGHPASDISGLGTAATRNVGSGANQIPALDSSGRLPAVDGSQLTNLGASAGSGRLLGAPRYLNSGANVVSANCTLIIVEAVGGGGGGGSADGTDTTGSQAGGGGGAGGYVMRSFAVTPGQEIQVTLGSGGNGGDNDGGSGGAGSTTTVTVGGVTLTASGGSGGRGVLSSADAAGRGGAGGRGFGGDINCSGEPGHDGYVDAQGRAGGAGGSSRFGLGGDYQTTEGNGHAAQVVRGGGGGGALNIDDTSGHVGGAGAFGAVRIWEYT